MSTVPGEEELRQYVRLWGTTGPLLEKVRDQEIREADTALSIRMFNTAFGIALRDLPPRTSSGLVEWQEFMQRRRRHG